MIIEPSLIAMLGGTLLSSSIMTSSYVNIDESYKYDKDAKKISLIGSTVGFAGLLIAILALLYVKLYPTGRNYLIGLFVFVWLILVILLFLSYFSYDYLDKSYHYPVGSKYVLNKIEKKLLFASFCLCLISVTVGLCYVFTHGIESEFFDDLTGGVFNIKTTLGNLFKRIKKKKITQDIEMSNFLNDLNVD